MRFLLLLSSLFSCAYGLGFMQSVSVKGKLICNDKPASGVKVKMYDKDVLMDTKLDEKTSDADGNFALSGGDTEISSIDPRVNIYHDCDDGWTPCQRRLTIGVPDAYITNGEKASKVFDLGTIQLAGKWVGETRDCIHRR